MQSSAKGLSRTIIPLHTHIFPKSLLYSGTRLRLAYTHVLSALEQLSLSPPSIDSFAILRRCGLWSCWRRTSGSDGQRNGGSRDGRMEALEVRWRTPEWHVPVTCVKRRRICNAFNYHSQPLLKYLMYSDEGLVGDGNLNHLELQHTYTKFPLQGYSNKLGCTRSFKHYMFYENTTAILQFQRQSASSK